VFYLQIGLTCIGGALSFLTILGTSSQQPQQPRLPAIAPHVVAPPLMCTAATDWCGVLLAGVAGMVVGLINRAVGYAHMPGEWKSA